MATTPGPEDEAAQAATQMAEATDRLREQARTLVDPASGVPSQRRRAAGHADGDIFATFRTTSYAGYAVLAVAGQVDIGNAGAMRRELLDLVDAGHTDVIVDLSGVTFMDSSGLNVVVGAARALKQTEGTLRVVAATRQIQQLFHVTGVHKVVPVHPTLSAATAP